MADDEREDAGAAPEDALPAQEGLDDTREVESASVAYVPEAPEPAGPPASAPRRGVGRRVTLVSLRIVRGLVGLAAAAATIAAVGLLPLPTFGIDPLRTLVEPEPADLQAVCPGALLRLGDDSGGEAGTIFPVGTPALTTAAAPGSVVASGISNGDAASSAPAQQPRALALASSDDAVLGAAQRQAPDGQGDLSGLAATVCGEPASSSWIVGGGTTLGRTSILQLVNPTAVAADVTLELWGEDGQVRAPGRAGIVVPAGGRVALPLSGFAPDLASPVVHVEARGGQVVAWLQTSVIRVLDPGGVDLVAAGEGPAREHVIPAVRIEGGTAVASSLGIEGYDDLASIIRLGNPSDEVANVEVSLTPVTGGASPSTFEVSLAAGEVTDTHLEAAHELGEEILADGSYTVSVRSDVPVVAGVRASTIVAPTATPDGRLVAGAADLAWFPSAPALRGEAALAVADAASPVLVAVAVDGEAHTLVLAPLDGGAEVTVEVPAVGGAAVALPPGGVYRIRGGEGVAAAVSFAGAGQLAGYPVVAPRAADAAIVVRP